MSWLAAGAAAAAVAAVWGAYVAGRSAGEDAATARQRGQEVLAAAAGEQAASAAAAAIARLRVINTTVTQEVRREIETRPVYRDCGHSAEQLQRLNAALTGATEREPAGGGFVPKAHAAEGLQLRRDD